jgi:hypothetical protein
MPAFAEIIDHLRIALKFLTLDRSSFGEANRSWFKEEIRTPDMPRGYRLASDEVQNSNVYTIGEAIVATTVIR